MVPTPGIAAGLLGAAIFVPVLVSHLGHNRSLGPVGYWFSVMVVSAQLALVAVIPAGGTLDAAVHWVAWSIALIVALWLTNAAFHASESNLPDSA